MHGREGDVCLKRGGGFGGRARLAWGRRRRAESRHLQKIDVRWVVLMAPACMKEAGRLWAEGRREEYMRGTVVEWEAMADSEPCSKST